MFAATLAAVIVLAIAIVAGVQGSRFMAVEDRGHRDIHFSIDGEDFVAASRRLPDGTLAIEIRESATGHIQLTNTAANPLMRWFTLEDQESIWFYSSDIGTRVLEKTSDGWAEATPQRRVSKQTFNSLTPAQQDRLRRSRLAPD